MIGLLLAVAAAGVQTPSPRAYSWNTYEPGRSIQFGLADTDDRSLRIDCAAHGRVDIIAPSMSSAAEGAVVRVRFVVAGATETRRGVLAVGDTPEFVANVPASDPVIQALMRDEPVVVRHAGAVWRVPGKGAQRVLGPLLKACSRKASLRP
jgi:hypothetical protein